MRASWLGVLAAAVTMTASAPALAKGWLAKGTPYAAETTASIIGTVDIHYADDQTTYQVCDPNYSQYGDSESKVDASYSLDWAANYPHVTVPVADTRELGTAYKRLHVPAQPTSTGHGGLMTSSYDIAGFGPTTTAGDGRPSDCAHQPYSAEGKFHTLGSPDFSRLGVQDFYGDTQPVYYFTMAPMFARPATYQDSLGNTMDVYKNGFIWDTQRIPLSGGLLTARPTWDSVPADFSIDELKQLVHGSTLRLHPNVYSGSADCGSSSGGMSSESCTVTWTFRWTVTLHRKFLYRTKAAYRR